MKRRRKAVDGVAHLVVAAAPDSKRQFYGLVASARACAVAIPLQRPPLHHPQHQPLWRRLPHQQQAFERHQKQKKQKKQEQKKEEQKKQEQKKQEQKEEGEKKEAAE